MIYVVSACRSGSGWLSTALYTLGFDVVHELFTVGIHGLKLVEPLVWADTTLVLNADELKYELASSDRVILLERDFKDIRDSIATLLPGCDCEHLIEGYMKIQSQCVTYPCPVVTIQYENLFTLPVARELANFLDRSESEFERAWVFLKDFRITNKTNEEAVKRMYEEAQCRSD